MGACSGTVCRDAKGLDFRSPWKISTLPARLSILTISTSETFCSFIRALATASSLDLDVAVTPNVILSDDEMTGRSLGLVVAHATESTCASEYDSLLDRCLQVRPSTPVVIVSDDRSPQKLIHWLRRGASDCLSEPVDRDRLLFLFESLTVSKRVNRPPVSQQVTWTGVDQPNPICCASPCMATLISQIRQLSPQRTDVIAVSPGNSTACASEEFAFHQRDRQRRPVDSNKRLIAPRGGIMKHSGQARFAGSGFTNQHHVRALGRKLLNLANQSGHARRSTAGLGSADPRKSRWPVATQGDSRVC